MRLFVAVGLFGLTMSCADPTPANLPAGTVVINQLSITITDDDLSTASIAKLGIKLDFPEAPQSFAFNRTLTYGPWQSGEPMLFPYRLHPIETCGAGKITIQGLDAMENVITESVLSIREPDSIEWCMESTSPVIAVTIDKPTVEL